MLVEKVHHEFKEAAFYTGIASAAASLGGFFSGILIGWLCDRLAPRKLLVPVLLFGGAMTMAMALSFNIQMLIISRFFAALATGGIHPVLQLVLTKITRPELRGTYFGWSGSLSTAGGIICSFLGGGVACFSGVRGVYVASAILLALMICLQLPAVLAIRKEELASGESAADDGQTEKA